MTISRLSCFAFSVLAACHSSHHQQPDTPLPIDAAPDSPPLNSVTVNTFGETPIFLAYRDGSGPWQTIDPTSNTYELKVTDAYLLVAVCGDATNGFDVGYQGQTFSADGPSVDLPCFGFGPAPGAPVNVTGTMVEAGQVMIGFASGTSATPNWQFDLSVNSGTHELVAASSTRVLIRRNLNITADTTVPNVDVNTAGSALVTVPVTITGADADETVNTRVTWFTGNDFALFPSVSGMTAKVVPDALIQATDSHRLRAAASTATTFRSTSERYSTGASTAFDLPPRLSNVTVAADHASWTGTLPEGTAEFYTENANATTFVDAHISGTPSWLGTQTTFAIDYNIPGFQPEWKVDFATADFADVDISKLVGMQNRLTEAFFVPPSFTSAARDAESFRGHRRYRDRSAGR